MRLVDVVNRVGRRRPVEPDSPSSEVGSSTSGPAPSALDQAEALAAEQRFDEAVDTLVAANRHQPDGETEIRLRDLRKQAADASTPGEGRSPWPPPYADPFPDQLAVVPEIEAGDLTTELMGGAVAHHGSLLVRGLLGSHQMDRMLDALHRAKANQSDADAPSDRWYRPVAEGSAKMRARVATRGGGTWLADSPAASAIALDELAASGAVGAITEHFGERPHFSLEKSTMRRTLPEDRLTGWHQDGSFLDPDVRSMNVWLSLSTCGGDHPASGLEVIPQRIEELLPKDPNLGNAAVAFDRMDGVVAEKPPARPEFEPGDALIFDEHLMHRTALGPHLTAERYALECWFFAPSHWTPNYTAFLV